MRPLGLSANALAKRIDVPVTRISEMVRGRRGITADTALRLARFFGTSPDSGWASRRSTTCAWPGERSAILSRAASCP